MSESHVVYPEGPPCNPHCPGEWSEYHDGYGDGYERGEREIATALETAWTRWKLVNLHLTSEQFDAAMSFRNYLASAEGEKP